MAEQKAALAAEETPTWLPRTVRQLQLRGFDTATITDVTGLTAAEVEKYLGQ